MLYQMPPTLAALNFGDALAPRIEEIILDFVLVGLLCLDGFVSVPDGWRL